MRHYPILEPDPLPLTLAQLVLELRDPPVRLAELASLLDEFVVDPLEERVERAVLFRQGRAEPCGIRFGGVEEGR